MLVLGTTQAQAAAMPTCPAWPGLRCSSPAGIRDHFVQSVELKFNCFFLMPIIDTFPTRLREELESAYEEDLDEVGQGGGGGGGAGGGAPGGALAAIRLRCGIVCCVSWSNQVLAARVWLSN